MMITNLGAELAVYYEKQFFLAGYGGDRQRAEYEWDYYQSPEYKRFIEAANSQNSTDRRYTDKRTKGWKYYLAHKEEVRTKYEKKNPVPKPVKSDGKVKTITFTRHTPLTKKDTK